MMRDKFFAAMRALITCRAKLAIWALVAIPSAVIANEASQDSVMAFWRFEELPGVEFSESKSWVGKCAVTAKLIGNTSMDISPRYGKPAPNVGGQSSLQLNNKTSADNEGGFLVSDPLPDMKGITGLTVEVWVNPETTKLSEILRSIGPKGDNQLSLELRNDGSVRFHVIRMGTTYGVASPPGSLVVNQWSHVAVVFGPKGLSVYINGKFSAGRSKEKVPWPEMSGSFGRLGIGAYIRSENMTSVAYFFDGQIDEIRITGRELEPSEFWIGNGSM